MISKSHKTGINLRIIHSYVCQFAFVSLFLSLSLSFSLFLSVRMIERASILFSLLGEISNDVSHERGGHIQKRISRAPRQKQPSCTSHVIRVRVSQLYARIANHTRTSLTAWRYRGTLCMRVWVRARSQDHRQRSQAYESGTRNARERRLETDPTRTIPTLGSARLRSGTLRMNEAKGALCHAVRDKIHVYASARARAHVCAMHG